MKVWNKYFYTFKANETWKDHYTFSRFWLLITAYNKLNIIEFVVLPTVMHTRAEKNLIPSYWFKTFVFIHTYSWFSLMFIHTLLRFKSQGWKSILMLSNRWRGSHTHFLSQQEVQVSLVTNISRCLPNGCSEWFLACQWDEPLTHLGSNPVKNWREISFSTHLNLWPSLSCYACLDITTVTSLIDISETQ